MEQFLPEVESRPMLNRELYSYNLMLDSGQSNHSLKQTAREWDVDLNQALPAQITKSASKQTYYTIRFLVDRDRVLNAYRAYSYFRWVDDCLDEKAATQAERTAFVKRQQTLVNDCYRGEWLCDLSAEERMLRDLIRSDDEPNSGLQSYIRNMMAVMEFDASRRGRLISERELAEYSRRLAVGVTDNLHYFIGHDDPPPQSAARYLAVTGAHITHMLRDAYEDTAAGYYNIPREFLLSREIEACDVETDAYKEWVESRVQLARRCFEAGKVYLAQVKNLRCRIAGYAYIARFETVLNMIEKEGYRLRPEYQDRKSLRNGLRMGWSLLWTMMKGSG